MDKTMRILLLSLVLVVFLAGSAAAPLCPQGDLNSDCKVNWEDIKAFAEQWLDSGECEDLACADFDGLNGIDFTDFAFLANYWQTRGVPLVINEFMASNSGTHDPQGDYDDWVEIYNFGDTSIDLAWMYLTDDLDNPTKWRVPPGYPAQTTVPADGFVVIWADEDTQDGPLHANFKLSAGGEDIGLFDNDGSTPIDTLAFGDQTTNISYGRYPDASNNWRFFPTPTAGADNNGAYAGEIEDVEFSHTRGFYNTSFNLTMACVTPSVSIYYTTNGKSPIVGEVNAPGSILYTAPVAISSTKCVRAAAIKTGWMPSPTATHTYIFGASDVIKSMPVVSLVGDADNTFYEPNGIMAIVGGTYVDGVWQSSGAGSYNNPIHRGIAYERPVSFEIINLPAGSDYQSDCGIRVHGSDYTRPRYTRGDNWLCNNNKFSFNLFFRSSYGNNRFEYQFFPFVEVDRYQSIVLRAGHNDICSPFVKDEWTRRLFLEMGGVQLTGTFANLYINGSYKYYYNPSGRDDEEFFQEWYGTDNDFDVINQSGVRDGDNVAWNNLLNYINSHDLSDTANYEYVAGKLDITTFIDFLILEIHIGNFDWPGNNWTVHRERSDTGIFRYSVWDAEGLAETWIFGNNCESCYKTAFEDFPSWTSPTGLNHLSWDPISQIYRALKVNPNFRQLFADRIHKHYRNGGVMTQSHFIDRWWEVTGEVSDVLPYQSTFVPNVFLPKREPYVLAAFETNGLFDRSLGAPVFKVNGFYKHGGYISASDTLTITDPCSAGTIYYTLDGNDPRLAIISQAKVIVAENAAKKVLVPTGDIGTNWRGGSEPYNDSGWTGGTGGVGYERSSGYDPYIGIDVESTMYNVNTTCYIRIPFNVDACDIGHITSLTLRMRYDDGFVAYINGMTEVKRMYLQGTTPTWNSLATTSREASSSFESFDISAYINTLHAGTNILAIHGLNRSKTDSDFLICAELVGNVTTGGGVLPAAIQYTGGFTLNKSTNLKARIYKSSSNKWSALNEAVYALPQVVSSLRITEIMYHPEDTNDPNGPNEEFIELKNISSQALNLNLVKFTKGIDFTFPPTELPAGGYVMVVKSLSVFQARYGVGVNIAGQYSGSLENAGERIRLEDAIGQTILDFEYKDGWRDITDGGGFSLTIINAADPNINNWGQKDSWRASAYGGGSPGWDDSGIVPNPGAVVINELLAHSHAGNPDWIELFNTTGEDIDIGGWYLSDSSSNLRKYKIAQGTSIPHYGYKVFYEDANFGASANDLGRIVPFALSENGEAVYLSFADANGVLTGCREVEDFGASLTDVSFGRYKLSTGNYNFVAMSGKTPNGLNAYPKVGPIVISEIMYHPDWPEGGLYSNDEYEYVELYNISDSVVVLYDSNEHEPWKFTDGVEYTFPDSPPVTIPAGGYVVVVRNPTAFKWRYPSVPVDKIYGPYSGHLDNGGESVEISLPGEVDEFGTRHYIRVDRVNYSDGSHLQDCPGGVDLWPVEADGRGKSLSRKVAASYGNDPNDWAAAIPSPAN
jgi:hypothetical protein